MFHRSVSGKRMDINRSMDQTDRPADSGSNIKKIVSLLDNKEFLNYLWFYLTYGSYYSVLNNRLAGRVL